jgi:hypothetical protein
MSLIKDSMDMHMQYNDSRNIATEIDDLDKCYCVQLATELNLIE